MLNQILSIAVDNPHKHRKVEIPQIVLFLRTVRVGGKGAAFIFVI